MSREKYLSMPLGDLIDTLIILRTTQVKGPDGFMSHSVQLREREYAVAVLNERLKPDSVLDAVNVGESAKPELPNFWERLTESLDTMESVTNAFKGRHGMKTLYDQIQYIRTSMKIDTTKSEIQNFDVTEKGPTETGWYLAVYNNPLNSRELECVFYNASYKRVLRVGGKVSFDKSVKHNTVEDFTWYQKITFDPAAPKEPDPDEQPPVLIEVDFKEIWLLLGELEAALRNNPGTTQYYMGIVGRTRSMFQNEGTIKHSAGVAL